MLSRARRPLLHARSRRFAHPITFCSLCCSWRGERERAPARGTHGCPADSAKAPANTPPWAEPCRSPERRARYAHVEITSDLHRRAGRWKRTRRSPSVRWRGGPDALGGRERGYSQVGEDSRTAHAEAEVGRSSSFRPWPRCPSYAPAIGATRKYRLADPVNTVSSRPDEVLHVAGAWSQTPSRSLLRSPS